MAKVTGIGGVFFKAKDPARLHKWYAEHLGFPAAKDYPGAEFTFREDEAPEKRGYAVWGPFKAETTYFEPSGKDYMINLRVDDLDGVLAQLKSKGIEQVGKIEDHQYGRFAWIVDPEGTKIELWEQKGEPPG